MLDLFPIVGSLLQRSFDANRTRSALLAHEGTVHITSQFADMGWACGYRTRHAPFIKIQVASCTTVPAGNAQMLFSAARTLPSYGKMLLKGSPPDHLPPIPTILEVQSLIEEGWSQGWSHTAPCTRFDV